MTAANQREMSLKVSGHGQTSSLLYGAMSGIDSNEHDESKTKQKIRQIYWAGEGGRICVLEIAYYDENEMIIWKWFHDDLSQINKNTHDTFGRLNGLAPEYTDAAKQWNETWKVIASFEEEEDWVTELKEFQLPASVEVVAKNASVTSEGVLAVLGEVKMTMARLKWDAGKALEYGADHWKVFRRVGELA
ncbi:hypothetical protein V8C43DRAFT_309656 [Trichoderma afarasin]